MATDHDEFIRRQRILVIRFRKAGLTMKEIADRPEVSVCADTVSRWCRKYTVAGMSGLLTWKSAKGKVKKTSEEEDEALLKIVKTFPYVPLSVILEKHYPGYKASLMTAYRTLKRLGYIKKKRPNEIRSIRVPRPKKIVNLSLEQRSAENTAEVEQSLMSDLSEDEKLAVGHTNSSGRSRHLARTYHKKRSADKTRSNQSSRQNSNLDSQLA